MKKDISNTKRSPLKKRQPRYPGQSLEKKINELLWEFGLLVGLSSVFIVLFFFEWWQWFRNLPPQPQITGIVAVVVAVYSYIKIRRIRKQLPGYRQGLMGEREVGHILNQLIEPRCTIFHDVLTGKFNIDHVVISPRGIYAIETKAISKTTREAVVEFNGEKVTLAGHPPDAKPVIEAKSHADWLRDKILGKKVSTGKPFTVKSVIVYPGWFRGPIDRKEEPWVLNPGMLKNQISQEPISLEDTDIERAIIRLEPYSHYFTTPTDESVA